MINNLNVKKHKALNESSLLNLGKINVICGNLLPAISGNQVIFHIDVPEIVGKENNIEEKAEALAKLSVDDEQCECYLFVDGDLPL